MEHCGSKLEREWRRFRETTELGTTLFETLSDHSDTLSQASSKSSQNERKKRKVKRLLYIILFLLLYY